jgi:hypothetical protein
VFSGGGGGGGGAKELSGKERRKLVDPARQGACRMTFPQLLEHVGTVLGFLVGEAFGAQDAVCAYVMAWCCPVYDVCSIICLGWQHRDDERDDEHDDEHDDDEHDDDEHDDDEHDDEHDDDDMFHAR